jgi:hypothetical protein
VRAKLTAAAFLVLFAVQGGCASSSAQPTRGESPEASAVTPDAGGGTTSGDAGATFSLSWSVALSVNPGTGLGDGSVGLVDAGDGGSRLEPIAGVKVCAMRHTEIACAMTASDGSFTISGLIPGQQMALTFEKPGYISLIRPIVMGKMDEQDTVPVLMSRTSDAEPDLGAVIDLQTFGAVQFFLVSFAGAIANTGAPNLYGLSDVPGVKVSMSPASGLGPYYTDSSNRIAFDAGSTVGFDALYFNVAPGDYTISVDDPNDNCAALSFTYASAGYPALSAPHGVAFPVVAGYTDSVGVLCTRNARIVNVDGG